MLKRILAWLKDNVFGDGTDKDYVSREQVKEDVLRLLVEDQTTRNVDATQKERVVDKTVRFLLELEVEAEDKPKSVQKFLAGFFKDVAFSAAADVLKRMALNDDKEREEEDERIRASLKTSLTSLSRKARRDDDAQ